MTFFASKATCEFSIPTQTSAILNTTVQHITVIETPELPEEIFFFFLLTVYYTNKAQY